MKIIIIINKLEFCFFMFNNFLKLILFSLVKYLLLVYIRVIFIYNVFMGLILKLCIY